MSETQYIYPQPSKGEIWLVKFPTWGDIPGDLGRASRVALRCEHGWALLDDVDNYANDESLIDGQTITGNRAVKPIRRLVLIDPENDRHVAEFARMSGLVLNHKALQQALRSYAANYAEEPIEPTKVGTVIEATVLSSGDRVQAMRSPQGRWAVVSILSVMTPSGPVPALDDIVPFFADWDSLEKIVVQS